jgi:hypothetical protein
VLEGYFDKGETYDHLDPKVEAERLIREALTTGAFTLANGVVCHLSATQIISLAKKYVDHMATGEVIKPSLNIEDLGL